MSQYFVRMNGSDNNPGTSTRPFRTIAAAIAAMNINGGDETIVGDGDYQEDTGGSGFLNINRLFLANTVIRSESGVKETVRVTGQSAAGFNILTNAANSNLEFQKMTFYPRLPTQNSTIRVTQCSGGLKFTGCKVEVPSSNAGQRNGIDVSPSGATTATGVTIDDCDIDVGANTNGCPVQAAASVASSTVTNVTIKRSRLTGRVMVINLLGGGNAMTGVLIEDNVLTGLGGYGVKVGPDSHVSAGSITSTIRSNKIDLSGGTGHGLLLGAGALTTLVEKNIVLGGDYAGVFKSDNTSTVRYNTFVGGPAHATNSSGMYFKGSSTNDVVTGNLIVATRGTTGALRVGVGDDVSTVTGLNITGCTILADGTNVKAYGWPTGGDAGNVTCNGHTFIVRNGANYGDLRAGTNLASLAALVAAWSGYAIGTNDNTSANQVQAALAQSWGW